MRYFRDVARQHVSWAMAALQWRVADAWQATPQDVLLAHEGWRRLNGLSADAACDSALLNNMMTSFPDG